MEKGLLPHHRRSMEAAVAFIDENLTKPLTLEDVSSACGMSKFHFTRIFKAHTGLTFKKHLNRRRIDRAKEILSSEQAGITEACYEAGFNDLSYFDRVFLRLEGMTPSQFRHKIKR